MKLSNLVMSALMLWVHSRTWGRMYTKKASEDHLPRIMMRAGLWFIRNRAMAAPERTEGLLRALG